MADSNPEHNQTGMTWGDVQKMFEEPQGTPEELCLSLMDSVAQLTEQNLKKIMGTSPQFSQTIEIIKSHNLAKGERRIQAQQIAQYLKENNIDANNLAALFRPEPKP